MKVMTILENEAKKREWMLTPKEIEYFFKMYVEWSIRGTGWIYPPDSDDPHSDPLQPIGYNYDIEVEDRKIKIMEDKAKDFIHDLKTEFTLIEEECTAVEYLAKLAEVLHENVDEAYIKDFVEDMSHYRMIAEGPNIHIERQLIKNFIQRRNDIRDYESPNYVYIDDVYPYISVLSESLWTAEEWQIIQDIEKNHLTFEDYDPWEDEE